MADSDKQGPLSPQWQMIAERQRVLDERVPCVRCGQPHRGSLSVCVDCDRHPRSSDVDELLAEVQELREELAAVKAELARVKEESNG